ncbi:MAG: hypothetical protein ABJE95_27320 [Byssovorax sp.]
MAKLPPAPGLALLGALLLISPGARAQWAAPGEPARRPIAAPPRPISPPPVIWYGWETLLTGAAAYLLPLAVLKKDFEAGLVLGSLLSPFTTMSMHMIHGDEVKGYVSLPLSFAMVAGGGALAAKLECKEPTTKACVTNAVFEGMILGGLSAVVLDAATLAWGRPAPAEPVKKAVLWPSVTPLQGGAAVGIGGAF